MYLSILCSLLLFHIVGCVSAVHAVSLEAGRERRRAVVLALLLIPYVSLPMYWLGSYGADARRPRRWKDTEHALEPVTEIVTERLRRYSQDGRSNTVLEKLGPFQVTGGNRIKLLINGEQAFPVFHELIDSAKDYILCQFYLIREDDTARDFVDRLIEARRRGTNVYIYYDPLESSPSAEFWAKARDCGIEIAEHRPARRTGNVLQADYRNHRKIFVVDGRIAIMGGLNLGDEYLSKVEELAPWRDTCFTLEGPTVLAAQWSFLRDFHWSGNGKPKVNWDAFEPQPGNATTAFLATGPYDKPPSCCLCFMEAFNRAHRRIWIATPFFSPDESGLMALELAVARGIEVRLLVPSSTEVSIAELIAWDFFQKLLPLGVKVYQNREGSMHQKVVLVDDELCLLGSANFDYRSSRLNHENIVWIESQEVAKDVEAMLRVDLENSRTLELDKLRQRTRLDWLKTSAARVFDMILGG